MWPFCLLEFSSHFQPANVSAILLRIAKGCSVPGNLPTSGVRECGWEIAIPGREWCRRSTNGVLLRLLSGRPNCGNWEINPVPFRLEILREILTLWLSAASSATRGNLLPASHLNRMLKMLLLKMMSASVLRFVLQIVALLCTILRRFVCDLLLPRFLDFSNLQCSLNLR